MDLNIAVDEEQSIITLVGKLTVATAPDFEEAIKGLIENATEIDIDVEGLDYIASAGLRVLVSAEKMAQQRGGKTRLIHPCDDVMDVLDMTGLVEVLEVVR